MNMAPCLLYDFPQVSRLLKAGFGQNIIYCTIFHIGYNSVTKATNFKNVSQNRITIVVKTCTDLPENSCFLKKTLREKCPSTELFLVRIFLYSVRIQENTEQK